jgi:hypothetical protein
MSAVLSTRCCADRIIAIVQAKRDTERARAYADWLADHRPEPEQLAMEAS